MFKGLTIDTIPTASAHIYAYDQSLIYDSMTGGDAVHDLFSNLSATTVSANEVRIAAGVLSIQGHFAYVSYGTTESFTIENGQTGYNRKDLLCAKFERVSNIDSFSLVTVKGTATTGNPTRPIYTAQDLTQGGTVRLFPLYEVLLTGLSVTSVTALFTPLKSLKGTLDGLLATVDANNYVLQTTNNKQRITRSWSQSCTFIYSSSTGTYVSTVQITLPSTFIATKNIDFHVSAPSVGVYDCSPVQYNTTTRVATFYAFTWANVGTQTIGFNLAIEGLV